VHLSGERRCNIELLNYKKRTWRALARDSVDKSRVRKTASAGTVPRNASGPAAAGCARHGGEGWSECETSERRFQMNHTSTGTPTRRRHNALHWTNESRAVSFLQPARCARSRGFGCQRGRCLMCLGGEDWKNSERRAAVVPRSLQRIRGKHLTGEPTLTTKHGPVSLRSPLEDQWQI
jgi:hypothetical protein